MRTLAVLVALLIATTGYTEVLNTAGPGTTVKIGKLTMMVNSDGTHTKCVSLRGGLCTK